MKHKTNTSQKKYDVFCMGRIVLDIYLHPVKKKDSKGDFFIADNTTYFMGGTAANTAFILKRLGAVPLLTGAVGLDMLGSILIQKLKKYDLYSKNICKLHAQTSTSYITIVKRNEPKFIHVEGVNQYFDPSYVDPRIIEKSKYLHIGGVFLLPKFDKNNVMKLINFAKMHDTKISADTTHNLSQINQLKRFPYLDVLFTNLEEAYAISKRKTLRAIATFFYSNFNFVTVVVKMGKKGCAVISKKGFNYYRGFGISSIDHCGAGDAFVGGFLYGLVNGWREETTAKFANACGAQTCLQLGPTNDTLTKENIISRFNLKGS